MLTADEFFERARARLASESSGARSEAEDSRLRELVRLIHPLYADDPDVKAEYARLRRRKAQKESGDE